MINQIEFDMVISERIVSTSSGLDWISSILLNIIQLVLSIIEMYSELKYDGSIFDGNYATGWMK